MHISNKLPGGAEAAGPGATRGESAALEAPASFRLSGALPLLLDASHQFLASVQAPDRVASEGHLQGSGRFDSHSQTEVLINRTWTCFIRQHTLPRG